MAAPILRYFEFNHLPEHLQTISFQFAQLAQRMDADLPDSAEKSAGLRKLLEAMVRAAVGEKVVE